MKYRYYNRSKSIVYLPNPRGGRTAIRPGEFVTDSYFERFSRGIEDKPHPNRVLIKEEWGAPQPSSSKKESTCSEEVKVVDVSNIDRYLKESVPVVKDQLRQQLQCACESYCQTNCMTMQQLVSTAQSQQVEEQQGEPEISRGPYDVEQVLKHHGFSEEDISYVEEGFILVKREKKQFYLSRYDLTKVFKKKVDIQEHLKHLQEG